MLGVGGKYKSIPWGKYALFLWWFMRTCLFWKLLIQGNLQSFLKKQLKTATLPHSLTPPQTVSFKGHVLKWSTRGSGVAVGACASRDSEALHSLFEPLSYLCSYFRDTTIRISHIFMNRFSEEWIAIRGLSMRNLVDPLGKFFRLCGERNSSGWLSFTILKALSLEDHPCVFWYLCLTYSAKTW